MFEQEIGSAVQAFTSHTAPAAVCSDVKPHHPHAAHKGRDRLLSTLGRLSLSRTLHSGVFWAESASALLGTPKCLSHAHIRATTSSSLRHSS
ncbi:Uncharacterized protein DAT39_021513 [Clarias magur]|uniref:Uncharacterized protein n=1 Tax=Clarias magur TaxID=1594786 RepID=A0A8J4T559_CLAMG|nr:Uncharacterized protein DAT39_021513 [Clarias magur]